MKRDGYFRVRIVCGPLKSELLKLAIFLKMITNNYAVFLKKWLRFRRIA
jgi:hypothetical protein